MTKYIGVKTLEVLEGADNYNKWIAESIKPHIQSPALEVGAGIGNISSFFTHLNELVLTDYDSNLVQMLHNKFKSKKNVHCETLDIGKQLGKIQNRFQSVYSVNVLEHIKDDSKALQNMNMLLKKGGKVVLLVPAKKSAYSKLDKELGHFRRYEKDELSKKLEDAHFTVEKIEYFNLVGLMSWVVRNYVSKSHKQLTNSHVKLFDSVVPILKFVEPKRGLPMGISLVAVGTKK